MSALSAASGEGLAQQSEGHGAADSANYAQSPRVPRSQISRAAYAAVAQQFGMHAEGTSAVVSGLSCDEGTCLSAAEAAGEHTSQPLAPAQQQQQQQAATADVVPIVAPSFRQQQSNDMPAAMAAEEAAGSPPGSVSPMYRANSLVSHTAAVPNLLKVRRLAAGETPASAPLLGSSPSTSKAEASGIPAPRSLRRPTGHHGGGAPVPRGGTATAHLHTPLRFAGPPTGPPGPSQPSTSQTQGSGPLPSTLAVAMGGTPPIGFMTPVPMQPASAPLAGLSGMGQHGLGSPAPLHQVVAALMPPPGATQPSQQQQQQYIQQQPLQAASQQEQAAVQATPVPVAQGSSLVVPPAQVTQLAALAPAHQATSTQAQAAEVTPGALQAGSEGPQNSAGAPSVLSMPSLVGNSAIQGQPLPVPIYGSASGAAAALAEQTPLMALYAGAAAVPTTVQSGAVEPASGLAAASPEPLAGASDDMPRQVALSLEQRAQQPATSWVMAAAPLPAYHGAQQAAQQAASMVEGRHSPANDAFAAAAEEAEIPLPPAEPQAAVIQELPVAEVMAASQQAHSGRAGAPEGREDMEVDGMTPGAAHGAASVMAAVVTQSDRRSDGDTGMQQTASGPSQPADGDRAHSPSPSAQPAAATAHVMHSQGTAATAPSQHGPTVSARAGAARHAPSSLATVSSGSGEKPGGSVGMDLGAATSAPPAPLAGGSPHDGDGEADEADPAIAGKPAASALRAPGLHGQGAVAAPATSASLSGLGEQAMGGEQAGAVADFAEHNPAVGMMAQSSVALAARPTASTCEGQNGVLVGPVMGVAAGAPGDVASPKASVLVPGPPGSEGTARGAIVAGAAASILTTAAAGEGEGAEEGVEALSPLQAAKAAALAAAAKAAANTGTVLGTGGAVSGNIDLGIASGLAMVRARSRAGGQSQPQHAMGEPPSCYALPPLPSTLAVDVELVGSPLAMASGQPSAALAFGGASQLAAGDDGMEVQQEVALPATGGSHVAHAHSVIGNGHAVASPEQAAQELTSPSRLVTHDSTAPSHSGYGQPSKRQRLAESSPAPASSSHARP